MKPKRPTKKAKRAALSLFAPQHREDCGERKPIQVKLYEHERQLLDAAALKSGEGMTSTWMRSVCLRIARELMVNPATP